MRYELTNEEWTIIKPMLPNKPRAQHALDRVGRGLDLVALGALGGGDQPLDRDFEQAPAFDGCEPLGEHVRGIAQRDQLGAVCERERARMLAAVFGAERLLEHPGQA